MSGSGRLLLEIDIAQHRYAVPRERVVEVALRVAITPLPGAPEVVAGVVAYRGDAIVAIDMRRRLGLPGQAPRVDDHMLVCRARRGNVALVVDRVRGLLRVAEGAVQASPHATPHVEGIVMMNDGLLVVNDLDAVLSDDEERAVARLVEPSPRAP